MSVEELKLRGEKGPMVFEAPEPVAKKGLPKLAGFIIATAVLALCFCVPLYNLAQLAFSDDLYSDIPLIPLISLYLIWTCREKLPHSFESSLKPAFIFFAAGLLVLALHWLTPLGSSGTIANSLAFDILALLCLFTGICFLFFGEEFLRAIALPLAMLIFTVPLPDVLRHGVETFLQHGSAIFAGMFFQLSGTPFLQDGLNFQFPNCTIQVAPECSGIHSTMVLAITSLAGAWLFLQSPWKRAVLVLAVIPLALIRNGFRIFVIGRLCAAYGPQMLASPIHRHGGPLFFALSLVPFFLLLLFLRKTEQPSTKKSL
jgi:exosortase C (VPDSG-CTERM-specific)